jgi:hippurate hydrolase
MTWPDSLFPAELREQLLNLRHDLHRTPELSFQEERTAERLHHELAALNPVELARIAGTGVIARIRGEDPKAPVVALRGDIDALPIQEATGLPYASERDGVMHACGHDVHATWTVGAAHLLTQQPAAGDVLILLQPGEETGRGALAVLESGVLNGAAAIFGAHVDRRFLVGQVVAQAGPLAAAADSFAIELEGRGAHGARPHEGIDPIVGAGALIGALQTIVSRRLSPGTPGVVSIGVVRAGTAPNVIPDTATLEGTLRSLDPETRKLLHEELELVVERTAQAHGLESRLELKLGPPPIVNQTRLVEWARQAVRSVIGDEALVPLGSPNMGGEDFAYYLERFAGCFFRVGAREDGGEFIPAHSPRFYAADESIFAGAAVLAETARIAANSLSATPTPSG